MKLCSTLFLLTLILLTSCAKREDQKEASKQEDISIDEINFIMNNQTVTCASLRGIGCPSGIARLLVVDRNDSEKSKICSGFMVSETVLVTNHHCVNSAKVCADTFIAVYNGYSYRRTKCESILKSYEDVADFASTERTQDFTVLKVTTPIFSRPFRVAKAKVKQSDRLVAWVVDQIDLYDSRITELRCKKGSPNRHKSMVLSGCPVISGNSGSPVLNGRREVVGVIWGASNDGSFDEQTLLSNRRKKKDVFGFATDISYFVNYL